MIKEHKKVFVPSHLAKDCNYVRLRAGQKDANATKIGVYCAKRG